MFINATLVVQAFHFFIAYVLIKRFFLRPALMVIEIEQSEEAALLATVVARRVVVHQKEMAKIQQWRAYQQEFMTMVPPMRKLTAIVNDDMPSVPLKPISQEVIHSAIKHVAQAVLVEVDHVR